MKLKARKAFVKELETCWKWIHLDNDTVSRCMGCSGCRFWYEMKSDDGFRGAFHDLLKEGIV